MHHVAQTQVQIVNARESCDTVQQLYVMLRGLRDMALGDCITLTR
jgi:hypothetical protein